MKKKYSDLYIVITEHIMSDWYKCKCIICGYVTELSKSRDSEEIKQHIEVAH